MVLPEWAMKHVVRLILVLAALALIAYLYSKGVR